MLHITVLEETPDDQLQNDEIISVLLDDRLVTKYQFIARQFFAAASTDVFLKMMTNDQLMITSAKVIQVSFHNQNKIQWTLSFVENYDLYHLDSLSSVPQQQSKEKSLSRNFGRNDTFRKVEVETYLDIWRSVLNNYTFHIAEMVEGNEYEYSESFRVHVHVLP